jgi:hypothetical protein
MVHILYRPTIGRPIQSDMLTRITTVVRFLSSGRFSLQFLLILSHEQNWNLCLAVKTFHQKSSLKNYIQNQSLAFFPKTRIKKALMMSLVVNACPDVGGLMGNGDRYFDC